MLFVSGVTRTSNNRRSVPHEVQGIVAQQIWHFRVARRTTVACLVSLLVLCGKVLFADSKVLFGDSTTSKQAGTGPFRGPSPLHELACYGWAEPRIYMESQFAFVATADTENDAGSPPTELGLKTCFPWGAAVGAGGFELLVHLQIKGFYRDVKLQVHWLDDPEVLGPSVHVASNAWSCQEDVNICEQDVRLTVDVAHVRNGLQWASIMATANSSAADGWAEQVVQTHGVEVRGLLRVANPSDTGEETLSHDVPQPTSTGGSGAYLGEFLHPWVINHHAQHLLPTGPSSPLQGVVDLRVGLDSGDWGLMAGKLVVSVDDGLPSQLNVWDTSLRAGRDASAAEWGGEVNVTLDTALLADGWHRLILRAAAGGAEDGADSHEFVLVFVYGFYVDNAATDVARALQASGLPDPTYVLTNPLDCSVWPDERVYVEAQNWFTNSSATTPEWSNQHVRVGGCMPVNTTVADVVILDLAISKFMVDNALPTFWSGAYQSAGASAVTVVAGNISDWAADCVVSNWCQRALRVTWDTSSAPKARAQVSLSAFYKIGGKAFQATLGFSVLVGWQTSGPMPGAGSDAGATSQMPDPWHSLGVAATSLPLTSPSQPAKGLVTFGFKMNGERVPLSRLVVSEDPVYPQPTPVQLGEAGPVVINQPTSQLLKLCSSDGMGCRLSAVINATALSTGWHLVQLRVDSWSSANASNPFLTANGGTFTTVLLHALYVDNTIPLADPTLPDPARPLVNYLDCTGWPEPRIYYEVQHWFAPWLNADYNVNDPEVFSEHVHVGACFPWNQVVAGTVTLDLLVQKHNMAVDERMAIRVSWAENAGGPIITYWIDSWPSEQATLSCLTTETCMRVLRVSLDSTQVPDGLRILQVQTFFRGSQGTEQYSQFQQTQAPVIVANSGAPGAGWPVGSGARAGQSWGSWTRPWTYVFANIVSALPYSSATSPLSGTLTFSTECFTSAPQPLYLTHYLVTVDAKFHAKPIVRGSVIAEQTVTSIAALVKTSQSGQNYRTNITLDTTALSNGAHKLFIRADSTVPSIGTASSVFLIAIYVEN